LLVAEKQKPTSLLIVHFLIPTLDRSGRPYRREVQKAIQRGLEDRFGGWSLVSNNPAPGAWKAPDTGEVEYDDSWRYEIGIPRDRIEELDEYLAEIADMMKQKALWRVAFDKAEGKVISARKPKKPSKRSKPDMENERS
jgi:hypothetical protein